MSNRASLGCWILSLLRWVFAGLCFSLSAAVPSTPLDDWAWRYPRPQGNDLFGAAFGAGTYVAVGAVGTLLTSPDGLHWESHRQPGVGDFSDVLFANGRFVAVGSPRIVLTSLDGKAWQEVTPQSTPLNETERLGSVAYGNGVWVIVGGGQFYSSEDGIQWTSHPVAVRQVNDIAFGAGKFLALGTDGSDTILAASTNGSTWSLAVRKDLGLTIGRGRLDFHEPRFAMVSNTHNRKKGAGGSIGCWTSLDGIAWDVGTPVPEAEFRDVAVGPASIVAVGHAMLNTGDDERSRLFVSTNGLNWTTNSMAPGNNLSRVVRLTDRFLAMGDDGGFWTSETGDHWTPITVGSDLNLLSVAQGDGRTVAVDELGQIMFSDSGGDWQLMPFRSTVVFKSIAFGRGAFVGVDWAGKILRSPDGGTWTVVYGDGNPSTGPQLGKVSFAGDTFVAVGGGVGVFTSPDGTTWTKVLEPPQTPDLRPEVGVAYGGGRHVVAFSFDAIYTSTDAKEWHLETTELVGRVFSMAYGNGRFVASGYGNFKIFNPVGFSTATSPDGVHWTPSSNPKPSFPLTSLVFGEGRFVGAVDRKPVELYSSGNGTEWISHEFPTQAPVKDLLFTRAGTILTVGENQTILESAPIAPTLRALGIVDGGIHLEIRGWPGQEYSLVGRSDLLGDSWTELDRLTLSSNRTNLVRAVTGSGGYFRLVVR